MPRIPISKSDLCECNIADPMDECYYVDAFYVSSWGSVLHGLVATRFVHKCGRPMRPGSWPFDDKLPASKEVFDLK